MSMLNRPYLWDEEAAFKRLEAAIWPEGPVCPHCGSKDRIYVLEGVRSKPSKKNPEGIVRHGLKKCGACRKQFTARMNTVFESSHVALHKWMQAIHLMVSSKKGVSAHQLHRTLEITYRSAWFLAHRIREAMRTGELAQMGGAGAIVEADETFLGRKAGKQKKRGYAHKMAALSLVERGGEVRSFKIDKADAANVWPIIDKNLSWESVLMTDEAALYGTIGRDFMAHFTVEHGKGEYVRGGAHTNTLESYFSVFKRGMKGVYQHCSEKHLHRYLAEFDFRYNYRVAKGIGDEQRANHALGGVVGKRLTYRDSSVKEAQA